MYCNKCGNMVDPSAKFCNKCGNILHPTNGYTPKAINTNIKDFIHDKQNYIIIGIPLLVIIIFIFLFLFSGKNVYFSNTGEISSSNGSTRKSTSYKTSINYDNTYEVSDIKDKNDVNELIVKDSNNEKSKCKNTKIATIENRIASNYKITAVNLCELDYDFALEIEKVVKTIYDNYPTARGYLTNLTLTNTSISNSYIAVFMPAFNFAVSKSDSTYPWAFKTIIGMNSAYYLNTARLEATVKDSSKCGHFPKNTTRYSPVAHEFGHYLSFVAMLNSYNSNNFVFVDDSNNNKLYKIMLDFNDGTFSQKMINEAYQNFKTKYNSSITELEFRESISKYAVAKDNDGNYIYDETIAEAFHDYYVNGDNAAKASIEIVSVLKSYLGSKG